MEPDPGEAEAAEGGDVVVEDDIELQEAAPEPETEPSLPAPPELPQEAASAAAPVSESPAVEEEPAGEPAVAQVVSQATAREECYAALQTPPAQRTEPQISVIESYLAEDKFLRGLDPKHLTECCRHLELRRLSAEQGVMTQGEEGKEFFILLEGDVELIINGESKNIISAHASFGELALTSNAPRSATIRCATDCVLALLHRKDFLDVVEGREELIDAPCFKPVIDWTPLAELRTTSTRDPKEIADTHGYYSRPKYVTVKPDEDEDEASPDKNWSILRSSVLDVKGVGDVKQLGKKAMDFKEGLDHSKDVRPDVLIFDRAEAEVDEKGWATNKTIEDLPRMTKQTPTPYEVWNTTEAEIGAFGGPGMRLYFYIVRSLAQLFMMMAILSIPTIVTFLSGEVYDESPLAPFGATLAMFTMGNIDDPTADIDAGKGSKLWWVSVMSVISSAGLLAIIIKMGHRMRKVIDEADHNAVSMADYSVKIMPKQDSWMFLSGIPCGRKDYKKAQEEHKKPYTKGTPGWTEYMSKKEEASHLGGEKRSGLEMDVKQAVEQMLAFEIEKTLREQEAGGAAEGSGRKHEKVNAVATIGTDQVGNPKPAIWTAWNERENIQSWTSKFDMFFKLEEGLSKACGPGGTTKSIEKVFNDGSCGPSLCPGLETLNKSLLDRTSKEWRPVTAFIAFETPFHRDLALKRKEIVVGDTVCTIEEAPEPESIQYQNLETSESEKRIRSQGMNILTIALIFLAAIGIVRVQIAIGAMAYLEDCSYIWGPDELETITQESAVCPSTNTPSASDEVFAMQQDYIARMELPTLTIEEEEEDSIYIFSQDQQLISLNTTYHPNNPAQLINAACYSCICNTMKQEWNNYTTILSEERFTDLCSPFKSDKVKEAAKDMLGTLTIVVMNQLLKQFIVRTTGWLHAHTKEAEMQSKATRVYLAQVMNTAILAALINSNLPVFADIRTAKHFDHANFEWFAKVGAPMTKTMTVQFTVPWVLHVVFYYVFKFKAWLGDKQAVTQNKLNQSREPNSWDIAAGYGEVLMAMTVTLLYGPGVPLLYWGAALGFTIRYWVDKWACLRVYRRPPLYGPEVIVSFDKILAVVVLAHCVTSMYFIGVAGVHGDVRDHVEKSKMVQWRMAASVYPPMFMVLCALVVVFWKHFDGLREYLKGGRQKKKTE
jgi:hypothetical protein